MAGHSKWSQIKNKKGITDQKRGALFSKLLKAIAIAARTNPDPQFNPRLRSMIEKAKAANVPNENIERAIKKSSEEKNLEEVVIEAYGPGKSALIIEGITDNKNRTIHEIRHILEEKGAKMGEPGSVLWSFEQNADSRGLDADSRGNWQAKYKQSISEEAKKKLQELIAKLEEHNDVQKVITNSN